MGIVCLSFSFMIGAKRDHFPIVLMDIIHLSAKSREALHSLFSTYIHPYSSFVCLVASFSILSLFIHSTIQFIQIFCYQMYTIVMMVSLPNRRKKQYTVEMEKNPSTFLDQYDSSRLRPVNWWILCSIFTVWRTICLRPKWIWNIHSLLAHFIYLHIQ